MCHLYLAVLPASAAQVKPTAQKQHECVHMLGRPADGHVHLQMPDNQPAVYHIYGKGDQFQTECRACAAGSGYSEEEATKILSNSHVTAIADMKDGKETNPAITHILGCPVCKDSMLENEYRLYCEHLGFIPSDKGAFGVERKFWKL